VAQREVARVEGVVAVAVEGAPQRRKLKLKAKFESS